jgi:hypothetical protein
VKARKSMGGRVIFYLFSDGSAIKSAIWDILKFFTEFPIAEGQLQQIYTIVLVVVLEPRL